MGDALTGALWVQRTILEEERSKESRKKRIRLSSTRSLIYVSGRSTGKRWKRKKGMIRGDILASIQKTFTEQGQEEEKEGEKGRKRKRKR